MPDPTPPPEYYAAYRNVVTSLRAMKCAGPENPEEFGTNLPNTNPIARLFEDDYTKLIDQIVKQLDADVPPAPLDLLHRGLEAMRWIEQREFVIQNFLEDLKRADRENTEIWSTLARYHRLGLLPFDLPPEDERGGAIPEPQPAPPAPSPGTQRPVTGASDEDDDWYRLDRKLGHFLGGVGRRIKTVALSLWQVIVAAASAVVGAAGEIRPSIGLVGPVLSLELELTADLPSLGEIFEAFRRKL